MAAGTPRDEGPSIRRHLVGGAIIALMLTGGLGGWAATTELSGAVIASGSVVVDSNVKKVQHLTGGIVGELLVRDGSRVRTGDIVVRLDETIMRANLAIVVKGLAEMNARQARLASERDRAEIAFPAALLAREHDPDVARAIDSERKLFELRRTAAQQGLGSRVEIVEQFVQQARLPDSRLSHHCHAPGRAGAHGGQRRLQPPELVASADQGPRAGGLYGPRRARVPRTVRHLRTRGRRGPP